MRIYLNQIPAEGLAVEGEDPCETLACADGQVRFEAPVHYSLMATRVSDSLLVRGRLWTEATLECGRCLKKFSQALVVEDFLHEQPVAGEEVFDLTENVREDILLILPQRALCREDCRGLCPQCGQDLNVQPCQCRAPKSTVRWEKLGQLKLK